MRRDKYGINNFESKESKSETTQRFLLELVRWQAVALVVQSQCSFQAE